MQANPNVDAAELRKFGDLAHRWWDPTGAFRPLHEINPLRLDWIDRIAPLAGRRVVDVGCGGGILSEAMLAKGARVVGIDLSEKALAVARLHALEVGSSVDYRLIPAEDLALASPGEFDVVTCMELLEHVPDPQQTVRACAQLARPGGHVFFSTIHRNPKSFLFAIVGAEYLLRLLPRGTHEYAKFIKPSELQRAAYRAGLDWVEMLGMSYNPLTRVYSLGPDVGVNYLVALRKPA
jgi:2-polyprenyl-6-hydroxyphenyl methylase/3-demethylubiquinone-9 3-methyltransferase